MSTKVCTAVLWIFISALAWSHGTSASQSKASSPAQRVAEGICQIKGPMTPEAFHTFVGCTARTLETVIWPENILPGIKFAGVPMAPNGVVTLHFPNDCSMVPVYQLQDRKIIFPYQLQYYSLYNQQAILAYLMGMPFVKTPEALNAFLETKLRPHLVAARNRCPTSAMAKSGRVEPLPPSVFAAQLSMNDRQELVTIAQQNQLIRRLEAFTANASVFFTLIHEYAHATLHNDGRPNSLAMEMEADAYAARVMEANKLPIVLSVGLFDLLHGSAAQGNAKDMACRMRRLMNQSAVSPKSANGFAEEFGVAVAQRLEDLRIFYRGYYGQRCKP